MGRRSTHTPQQLRVLILDAAQEIIEAQGLAGLSAREIARRVGYSPGTIYNIFANLDDVVLNVEGRVLDALDARLSDIQESEDAAGAEGRLIRIAHGYLAFTLERPRLWNLLFEHHMPAGTELPSWYEQKLERLMGQIERALAPYFPPAAEAELKRAAGALWAGVHGIASLASAAKLPVVKTEAAGRLIDDLVGTYLAGLAGQRAPGAANGPAPGGVGPPPPMP